MNDPRNAKVRKKPPSKSDLLFSDEPTRVKPPVEKRRPWKIIIADDEQEVHAVTKMVLSDYLFEGRGLQFLNAYSGAEAKRLCKENPDAAIILLDVVMETENAGLGVARYIREVLHNSFIRIILRTGQPGKAPERKVIMEYDINEYKEKTELTTQKLFTTVTSSLRSYRGLRTIEKSRKGLEQIITSSSHLFRNQSLKHFTRGMLTQLLSILHLKDDFSFHKASGFAATRLQNQYCILAATGVFLEHIDQYVHDVIPKEILAHIDSAMREKTGFFIDDAYIGYFQTDKGSENLLYLNGCRDLTDMDKDLIRIFSNNVAIAFDNIYLNMEIVDTQKEVIFTLGEVVDTRSKETANHVRRVAESSYVLAKLAGLSDAKAELLRLATPMHDVGKIGIPDDILNKEGRFTPKDITIMKLHTVIGYEILKKSSREIMQAAAIVAQQHHERWDGKGYHQGLAGEQIHIFGRISSIADVFDALSHNRVYKDEWDLDRIVDLFKAERGKHFDPRLCDIFLDNLPKFVAINDRYYVE